MDSFNMEIGDHTNHIETNNEVGSHRITNQNEARSQN